MVKQKILKDSKTAFLFIIIPIIFLILGYFINPYPPSQIAITIVKIPMFLGLILLAIGFVLKDIKKSSLLKISGWIIFAFYWSTQPTHLYIGEGGDIFNSTVCIIGVFVLFYISYHEWLSIKRNESISCLDWIAGASCIAGIIYFGIENSALADFLIKVVASHSTIALDLIIGNAELQGTNIFLDGEYAVSIIFACTGIQSMVIFVGMLGALPKVDWKKKTIGILVTVIPIYILNFLRNAMVAYLTGKNITDFNMAHNILAKSGALIVLIVLLFIIIKIVPEVFDEIFCLTDLYKRNGPLEKTFKKIWSKK
jgi:archaeosortase A (PGF-CTERM-specific)